MRVAEFNKTGHATSPGWATYHQRPMRRWRLRCLFGFHVYPCYTPIPANGHSPGNYAVCVRCGAFMHWYVKDQHRLGSL